MNLEISEWKEFRLEKLFDIKKGKRLTAEDQEEGEYNYIGAIDSNNGVANHIGQKPIHEANTISLSYNGSVGEAFYQNKPYWATDDVNVLYSRYDGFNESIGLFVCTVIRQEKYKFSYGRKWTLENMNATYIKLPIQKEDDGTAKIDMGKKYSDDGYIPDWEYMERFMKTLHHKPLTTSNTFKNTLKLDTQKWKFFYLKDICKITMGNKLDFSYMTFDEPSVNFVGRSADNNGVAGKVDIIEDVIPYPKGSITVALGGSLGSAYVQDEDFYTSQNVSVLEFESDVSLCAKLFITTSIMNECKYKYFAFGRELNTHIRTDFGFALPIKMKKGNPVIDNSCKYSDEGYLPDWRYMEQYIKTLPFGERV